MNYILFVCFALKVLSSPSVEEEVEIPNSASKAGVDKGKSKEKDAPPKVTYYFVYYSYYPQLSVVQCLHYPQLSV